MARGIVISKNSVTADTLAFWAKAGVEAAGLWTSSTVGRPGVRKPINNTYGMECIDAHSDSGSATARFADGSEARGDLLIAADGFRSTVRARLLPELQPAYAGYVT
jgi:hypothetical protein